MLKDMDEVNGRAMQLAIHLFALRTCMEELRGLPLVSYSVSRWILTSIFALLLATRHLQPVVFPVFSNRFRILRGKRANWYFNHVSQRHLFYSLQSMMHRDNCASKSSMARMENRYTEYFPTMEWCQSCSVSHALKVDRR